jgi:hypothetical protein
MAFLKHVYQWANSQCTWKKSLCVGVVCQVAKTGPKESFEHRRGMEVKLFLGRAIISLIVITLETTSCDIMFCRMTDSRRHPLGATLSMTDFNRRRVVNNRLRAVRSGKIRFLLAASTYN